MQTTSQPFNFLSIICSVESGSAACFVENFSAINCFSFCAVSIALLNCG